MLPRVGHGRRREGRAMPRCSVRSGPHKNVSRGRECWVALFATFRAMIRLPCPRKEGIAPFLPHPGLRRFPERAVWSRLPIPLSACVSLSVSLIDHHGRRRLRPSLIPAKALSALRRSEFAGMLSVFLRGKPDKNNSRRRTCLTCPYLSATDLSQTDLSHVSRP